MTINKPFYRTCRQFKDGTYANGGKARYIKRPEYAKNASHFVRPFILIQKDLINLFDYVEPSDQNLKTYSFRIHELLLRTCVEIEANFKAILRENGYSNPDAKKKSNAVAKKKPDEKQLAEDQFWNITDYRKVNDSHFLSLYKIILPNWDGDYNIMTPFEKFYPGDATNPSWYIAYNATKHDRYEEFKKANFHNLISAVAGLLVLLSSQFYTKDFSSQNASLVLENEPGDVSESGIGGYFRVLFPSIPEEDRYDFSYEDIRKSDFHCAQYQYNL